jgi:hypothetical protein
MLFGFSGVDAIGIATVVDARHLPWMNYYNTALLAADVLLGVS